MKASLSKMCAEAGREDTLVRIVCQELEAWYFGDLEAFADVFSAPALRRQAARVGYRDPDAIAKPSKELIRLYPAFQKTDGARRMAERLSYGSNRSPQLSSSGRRDRANLVSTASRLNEHGGPVAYA